MSVTRLVWKGHAPRTGELLLPPEVSHHARVARLQLGEAAEVLDLEGAVGIGVLVGWDGKRARVRVDEVRLGRGEPPGPLVVGLGVLHTQAFDWAVEKLTELGVTHIVPVLSERVQGRRHELRVERWQRLSEAAVAQCGRSRAAVVEQAIPLVGYLRTAPGFRIVADLAGSDLPRAMSPAAISLLVGPEGGLTGPELDAAREAGFAPLTLGPRTLRAETAAVAAAAVAIAWTAWR